MAAPEYNPDQEKEFNPYEIAVETLIRKALAMVEHAYGPNSQNPQVYHGLEHSVLVLDAVTRLADAAIANGTISPHQKPLLKISAAYHDAIRIPEATDNEWQSAQLAATRMRITGLFTPGDIRAVKTNIEATEVKSVRRDRIIQAVDPNNYSTLLIADADLATLGSPLDVYWPAAQRFFAETNPGRLLQGGNLKTFAHEQLMLVNGHQYHTQEAREMFNNQPEISDFLQTLVA